MTKASSTNAKKRGSTDLYTVQCLKCLKWRIIPTQEEFEGIRSTFIEDPFFCNKRDNVSCDDPIDIEYDSTRTWVMDQPNLPKTPAGFKRELVLRKDYSKMDVYYITPNGKKLRTGTEVASFLEGNPAYRDLSVSNFSFKRPKVMEDTVPEDVERKTPASGTKSIKRSRED